MRTIKYKIDEWKKMVVESPEDLANKLMDYTISIAIGAVVLINLYTFIVVLSRI